jgi:hypothetical protein
MPILPSNARKHSAVFYHVSLGPSEIPRRRGRAAELGFEHPVTGEQMLFKMEPPEDFGRFLAGVRKQRK